MNEVKSGFSEKTMDKIIRRKVNAFFKEFVHTYAKDAVSKLVGKTEEDTAFKDALVKEFVNDTVVAGGAFASMLQGDLPNDFDLYFQTKDVAEKFTKLAVAGKSADQQKEVEVSQTDLGINIFAKSAGVIGDDIDMTSYRYFEWTAPGTADGFFNSEKHDKSLSLLMATSNALSFSKKIQVIIRFCGTPETIVSFFDYEHTKNYWTANTGVVLNMNSVMCIINRRLVYGSSLFPVCALFRLRKFIKRGWHINAGNCFKIAYDINKLDLNDYNVLRDQLTGVDQAYFNEVIDKLNNRRESGEPIDGTYLFRLMDQVFDDAAEDYNPLTDVDLEI